MDIAIIAANNIVNIALYFSGFIPSASANSKLTVDANKGFQMIFNTIRIIAPPIHTRIMSLTLTASISPNKSPIKSNLIVAKRPITTKPIAKDECASNPSKASDGKLVVFCNFNKINATIDEITNTDNAILISVVYDKVTPNKAE